MAEFNQAFTKTMSHEGGYVFDPDDAGGETYRGVSRRFHPSWYGWIIIDKIKKSGENFNTDLNNNEKLQNSIKSFYKQNFWDRFQGDNILNQTIAEELFDTSVNMGIYKAIIFLQRALNLLNRNYKSYPNILEDGIFGSKTLGTLKTYLMGDEPDYLLKIMNTLQGMHYINYAENHPEQKRYMRGWLHRI